MITNKYVWINRDILKLNLVDRKLGLICRVAELMIEDGSIMEEDEKEPAKDKYLREFTGIGSNRFNRVAEDLIKAHVIFYNAETHTYKMNEKYIILPSTKRKGLKNYVRMSCSNFDKLFPSGFDIRTLVKAGHLVRLGLNIGVVDNSVRENVFCANKAEFVHLGLDEVFADYSQSNIYRIESILKEMSFKGKQCVEFYPDRMVVNPLLFNTTGVILRKKSETKPFISEGEEMTRLFLDKYEIPYEEQKRFDGLVGINGGDLSYDFFLPNQNILIECQGSQHYFLSGYTDEEAFAKQREHDHRKWEYAKNHNIQLIELPYWHYKDAEKYLIKYFQDYKKR